MIISVIAVYILSVGPVAWMRVHVFNGLEWWNIWAFNAVSVFYYPLELILPESGPIDDLFLWYLNLWVETA